MNADSIRLAVNGLKLAIPIMLVILAMRKPWQNGAFSWFMAIYFSLLVYALVVSMISEHPHEGLNTWIKYVLRLIFAYAAGIMVLGSQRLRLGIMKCLVWVGVGTVFQYAVLVVCSGVTTASGILIPGTRSIYYGPYGLLGNQTAAMYPPGLDFRVFRLTGFWMEPSNASGFLLMCYFLAQAIRCLERKDRWRVCGLICLLGGLLALSNVGYLSLAAAVLFGVVFGMKFRSGWFEVLAKVMLAILLCVVALTGRKIVMKRYPDVPVLAAVVGTRPWLTDQFDGRIQLVEKSVEAIQKNPLGIGLRIPGEGHHEEASASAPVAWMTYTGIIGLMLLVLREAVVLRSAIQLSTNSVCFRHISQAWVALLVQHAGYGTLISPLYLLLCMLVLSWGWECRVGRGIGKRVIGGVAGRATTLTQSGTP